MRVGLFFILIVAMCWGSSCTRVVTKSIAITDSTVVKSLLDTISLTKKTIEHLQSEVKNSQYSSVSFDTVYVPGDTVVNTVVVNGPQIVAKGRIKSASISNESVMKLVREKEAIIDSLSKSLDLEKKNVKIVDREVAKKTKVFVGWWLLVVGFLGGTYIGVRYKNFFIS